MVAVDCGIKLNILRSLNRMGCDVTVVPWNITAEEVEALGPDGLFLSNGPGNPEDAKPVIRLVQALRGSCPFLESAWATRFWPFPTAPKPTS